MSKKYLKIVDIISRSSSRAKSIKPVKHVKQISSFMSKTVLIFTSLGIVIFLTILLISLSNISLDLNAKQEIVKFDLDIILDKYLTEINLDKNLIPGHLVTASYEQVKRFSASGEEYLEKQAQGMITVFNDYSNAGQVLIPTTRFLSKDGFLFRSPTQIIIPGKKGDIPGSVEVLIIADQPGSEFNIGPSKFKLPAFGEMQSPRYDKIWAQSYKAMKGGAKDEVLLVSEQDVLLAKKGMRKELEQKVVEKLEKEVEKTKDLIINKKAVIERDFYLNPSAEPGIQAHAFNVAGFIEMETLAYKKKDLHELIQSKVRDVINPETQEIFETKEEYIFVQEIIFNFNKGQIQFQIHVEYPVFYRIDKDKIKKDLTGKNIEQIKKYLKDLPGLSNAHIEIWPSFSKYLPSFIRRIKVNVN